MSRTCWWYSLMKPELWMNVPTRGLGESEGVDDHQEGSPGVVATCRPRARTHTHTNTHTHTQETLRVVFPVSLLWQIINTKKENAFMSQTLSSCCTSIHEHLHMIKFVSLYLHTNNWRWAQVCPVLELNTNAQRLPLLSHLLRSPLYTFVQNCYSFPHSL